jgi:hypothetical protein
MYLVMSNHVSSDEICLGLNNSAKITLVASNVSAMCLFKPFISFDLISRRHLIVGEREKSESDAYYKVTINLMKRSQEQTTNRR